ncbi:hypothetical protein [Prochlorococcus marinus]|nr:hypothetical protein [Prochlorococcus marinus]
MIKLQFVQIETRFWTLACKGMPVGGLTMESFFKRRINIATGWASSRIALLDSIESYEDSYAITQEFKEWIICLESKSDEIHSSVLKFPKPLINSIADEASETDELLEL